MQSPGKNREIRHPLGLEREKGASSVREISSAAEPQPNESELKKEAEEFSHRVTEVQRSPPCALCLCERRFHLRYNR